MLQEICRETEAHQNSSALSCHDCHRHGDVTAICADFRACCDPCLPGAMAATEDLPLMLTQAVSVEVERIGNKGSSGQIPRIMRILEHYAAYANNMAKVLVAIKNMCVREDSWVVRLYLQRQLPRVIAAALRAHPANGNFVARACEVISAVSHVVRIDAVTAFTAHGTVEALVGCLATLQEEAPAAARVLQTMGFMAAHGNEVSRAGSAPHFRRCSHTRFQYAQRLVAIGLAR